MPRPSKPASHYVPFGTDPDDQVKPNSGVMYQGMDMTAPVPFQFGPSDAAPPRKPSSGSVLSGLRGKAPPKPRQIVGLNGEPYTPKTRPGGPVGLN